ncbi:MAG: glycosyltransferase family 39 protein [Candidatus Baltobacteraceae bacterium]
MRNVGRWELALAAVLLLGLALRLHGIHDPLLDHPGWRQGDTAAIARNFARLQYNVFYPQTTYNGPPPNYVELELQIVPFVAATLYRLFGVHEVFGRGIALAFSLLTIATLGYFGRWLFDSALAGVAAAFCYAIFPGSIYYGRTFMPDAAMVFFLTAALYAATRYFTGDRASWRAPAWTTALLTLAYLAKPVAVVALVPLAGLCWERLRRGRPLQPVATTVLFAAPLLVLGLYGRAVAAHAEWHWASGIMRLHVLPALVAAFESPRAFADKLVQFRIVLGMLRQTMLGGAAFLCSVAAFVALPWIGARSKALLWCWLAGGLAYVFVVVTVERVDYYMYPLLPLCALVLGGAIAYALAALARADAAPAVRYGFVGLLTAVAIAAVVQSRAAIAPYYAYNKQAYRDAVALDRALPRDALVVIGHYGPDVQYYVDRFGWEEDAALWTPFDEESAIRKGARYFISIEDNRLRHNLELCAWLQRFPLLGPSAQWPVYLTDPAKELPGADGFWRAFRKAERIGAGRAFLDATGRCRVSS